MNIYPRTAAWACLLLLAFSSVSLAFPALIDLAKTYEGIVSIEGEYANGQAGIWVCSGDINGDGIDDAVIGSLRASPHGRNQAGEVYVIFGSEKIFDSRQIDLVNTTVPVLKICGELTNDNLGCSVSAGDVNHDGCDDIIIGAPNSSKAYIVFGSKNISSLKEIDLSTPPLNVVRIYGIAPGEQFGFTTFAADINGDGFKDAILGAPAASPLRRNASGEVVVLFGSKDLSSAGDIYLRESPQSILRIIGGKEGDWFGVRAVGGDINGDGFDDVIIGSWFADARGNNSGAMYVVFGSAGMTPSRVLDIASMNTGLLTIAGENAEDLFGFCITPVNVDNDGFRDILVSGHGYDYSSRNEPGASYVIRGSSGLAALKTIDLRQNNANVIRIIGENSVDHLARGLSADLSGDGIPELVVTASDADPLGRDLGGKIFILPGPLTGLGKQIDLAAPPPGITSIIGGLAGDHLGNFIAAGDLNHDGYPDLIIGAHTASPLSRNLAGRVYLVSGKGVQQSSEPSASPFKFTAFTGNKASLYISANHAPMIRGKKIEAGDEIGVFTPGGLCAGAGTWTGQDLLITVWGDDPQIAGINGFRSGERYYFRIRDISIPEVIVAQAVFIIGPDAYQVDGVSILSSLGDGGVTKAEAEMPGEFSLSQNYPNPFNQVTVIDFTIAQRDTVTLKVFNSLGKEVATLVNDVMPPGQYSIPWKASGLASGIYFYRLDSGTFTEMKKLTLIK
ncbi:MAG: T9SS type A sorting domain-containing protein [Candidatus Latescibacter sp.]|nr:T9SS type A sorting domain-containing protein [Candidatus Latescibacter sp.]